MQVTHELTIYGRCPVNDALDVYLTTIETKSIVKVEDIIEATRELPSPAFQEEVTIALAGRLRCKVTTIGFHSGIKTTCKAG